MLNGIFRLGGSDLLCKDQAGVWGHFHIRMIRKRDGGSARVQVSRQTGDPAVEGSPRHRCPPEQVTRVCITTT